MPGAGIFTMRLMPGERYPPLFADFHWLWAKLNVTDALRLIADYDTILAQNELLLPDERKALCLIQWCSRFWDEFLLSDAV